MVFKLKDRIKQLTTFYNAQNNSESSWIDLNEDIPLKDEYHKLMMSVQTASRNKEFSGMVCKHIYLSEIDADPVFMPQESRFSKLSDISVNETKSKVRNEEINDEYEGTNQRRVMSVIQPKQKKFLNKLSNEYDKKIYHSISARVNFRFRFRFSVRNF